MFSELVILLKYVSLEKLVSMECLSIDCLNLECLQEKLLFLYVSLMFVYYSPSIL